MDRTFVMGLTAAAAAVPAAILAHWALFMKNPAGISGPNPLPLVGNALSIPATITTEFLVEMRAKYGKVFVLWFYWRPVIFVSEIEKVREICCGKSSDLFVRYTPHIHSFKNNSGLSTIFSSNEDRHFQARMTLMKMLGRSLIEQMIPKMHYIVRSQILAWAGEVEIADCLNSLMFRLVINTLLFSLFGISEEDLSKHSCRNLEYQDLFSAEGLYFMKIPFSFLISVWPGQSVKPNGKIKNLITELFESEKARAIENASDKNLRGSFIKTILLETRKNPHLDYEGAIEICSELLTNGTASIVRVMTRGLLLLYRDQGFLNRVRSELDTLWPFSEPLLTAVDSSSTANFNSWNSAVFLNRVVKETIRIVAPSREVERCAKQDVELSFGRFAKHTQFIVPTALVGWDADLWQWPDHFNPDRFLDESLDSKLVNFGMGNIGCLGQGFSFPAMNIMLGHVATHLQLALQPTLQVPVPMDGYTPVVIRQRLTDLNAAVANGSNVTAIGSEPTSKVDGPTNCLISEASPPGNLHLLVVFATVTGTARSYATRIDTLAKSQPLISSKIIDIAKFDPDKDLASRDKAQLALVVVCSSYGFGDPPPSATNFMSWLQGKNASVTIAGLRFAVLGLGSSYYQESYQGGALCIDGQLESLGGKRIIPVGKLDQLAAHEDQFIEWSKGFWPALQVLKRECLSSGHLPSTRISSTSIKISEDAPGPETKETKGAEHTRVVTFKSASLSMMFAEALARRDRSNSSHIDEISLSHWKKMVHSQSDVESNDSAHYILKHEPEAFEARVIRNDELQGSVAETTTRAIEFERLDKQPIGYMAGDYVTIFPQNHPSDIDYIIGRMGWDPTEIISITTTDERYPVPDCYKSPRSIRDMIKDNVDICARPTKLQLRALSRFCTGGEKEAAQRDHRMLFLLGAPSAPAAHPGTVIGDLHSNWIIADGRDTNDVFRSFPSVQLNISEYLELMDHTLLKARQYSISSSHLTDPAVVGLCVRLAEFQTSTDGMRVFRGVASDFLCSLKVGQTLPFSIQMNPHMRIPPSMSAPILLFGAGSGMSLLRSILQSRVSEYRAAIAREKSGSSSDTKIGKITMVYGCRAEDVDELYKSELIEAQKLGLLRYHPAFSQSISRDAQGSFGHVQNMIVEVGDEVCRALLDGAYIYTCGSKAMGLGIHRALLHVLEEHAGMSPIESAEFLNAKSRNKSYVRDIFG